MDLKPTEQSRSTGKGEQQGSLPCQPDGQTQSTVTTHTESRPSIKVAILFFMNNAHAPDLSDILGLFRLMNASQVVLTCVMVQPTWLSENMTLEEKTTTFVNQVATENESVSTTLFSVPLDLLEVHFNALKSNLEAACAQASVTLERILTFGQEARDAQLIQDALQRTHQDLVIFYQVDSTGEAAKQQASQFFKWLKQSPMPFFVYRRGILPSPQKAIHLLLGIDQSEASMNAARCFPKLVRPDNIRLTLAHVQNPIYQENGVFGPYVNQAVLDEAMETNASLVFEMATDLLDAQNIIVSDRLRALGSPGPALKEICQQTQPDLVIVGAHNRKGFLGWLLGSVSNHLLQEDTHNLLIIH